MVFMETGSSFVPAKPEHAYREPFDTSKTISDVNLLPKRVKTVLEKLLDGAEAFEKKNEEGGGVGGGGGRGEGINLEAIANE